MKKTLYIALPVIMLFTLSSCDWFNSTFLGKPSKKEIADREKEKARRDSLARVEMENRVLEAELDALDDYQEETGRSNTDELRNRYYIVVGCFKVRSNADRMMSLVQNNGFQPKMIRFKNGFSCVSAVSFPDVHVAYNEMYKMLRFDFAPEDIWVYDTRTNLHLD
jgi:hypothetical protein